jgi:hypothetical protein
MVRSELKKIDSCLSMHDFRVVDGPTRTNLIFDVVIPHEFRLSEEEVRLRLVDGISEIDKKYALVIMFDADYISIH